MFSQSIGASCWGAAYVTANQVPNLIYELARGGADERHGAGAGPLGGAGGIDPAGKGAGQHYYLGPADLVDPHFGAADPGDHGCRWADRSLLTPANANVQCAHAQVVAATRSMLQVFAPQAVLYGLSVVLFGLLQAYRRFAAPALAPLVSSLVLIAAYLAFVPLDKGLPLARLPASAELVLSVGTTLGIAALVLVALVPVWRLHLRLRPVLRFPPGWRAGPAAWPSSVLSS